MKTNRYRHLLVATPLCAVLVSCSNNDDSTKSDPFYGNNDQGRLVGGIEGFAFTSVSRRTNSKTNIIDTITNTGVTDVAGQFTYGTVYPEQDCRTDTSTNEQRCYDVGPLVYGPTTFSLCGVALPILPGPTTSIGREMPSYTAWDFFSDDTTIRNMASVVLMGNTNGGDPAKTGIKLSSAIQNGTCQDITWSTPNIQQDAASFQSVARNDGMAHEWPSEQAVTDYLTKSYLCAHSGFYLGAHRNTTMPGFQTRSMDGTFHAVVDDQGQVDGYMDFSRTPETAPYPGIIWFAGAVAIAPGGVGSVRYTAPADAPMPGLNISMSLFPHGASGMWQTADGSMSGTTEVQIDNAPSLGMTRFAWKRVPKYRFLGKNVSYTRPGGSAPENFVLEMEVGYNNKVSGGLWSWPEVRPYSHDQALEWHGDISGNTISLTWYDNGTPSTDKTMKLTLDPNTTTLTGTFIGKDGGEFITFGDADPLQGCRL